MAYMVLGITLMLAGAVALVIGGYAALTSHRPRWLSTKTIRSGFERSWGVGLGLSGLGCVLVGAGDADIISQGLGLAAYALIVAGVACIVLATPRAPVKK